MTSIKMLRPAAALTDVIVENNSEKHFKTHKTLDDKN
jgi:hypothetical protein